eukprot:6178064-Pleurochrysis_carterae.AAC.3
MQVQLDAHTSQAGACAVGKRTDPVAMTLHRSAGPTSRTSTQHALSYALLPYKPWAFQWNEREIQLSVPHPARRQLRYGITRTLIMTKSARRVPALNDCASCRADPLSRRGAGSALQARPGASSTGLDQP